MSRCGSCKLYWNNGCEGDLCIGECAETLQDYICEVLARAEAAEARAEMAEKERDAAVNQMRGDCEKCAHYTVIWNGCTGPAAPR